MTPCMRVVVRDALQIVQVAVLLADHRQGTMVDAPTLRGSQEQLAFLHIFLVPAQHIQQQNRKAVAQQGGWRHHLTLCVCC